MSAWKHFEAQAARLFGGKRFWANSGERLDFKAGRFFGQCKLVKSLSLNALTKLAEEMEMQALSIDCHETQVGNDEPVLIGVVCVKVRRGCGKESAPMVVMTFEMFERVMWVWDAFYKGRPEARNVEA